MCEFEVDVGMEANKFTFDFNGGLTVVYILEEDSNCKEQLVSFREESLDARRKTALYRENKQQLLEEGKLARFEFFARL
jgi:hypothetical protein